MKFIADSMLGKLSRWLRMMGHDVTYNVQISDNELLERAKKESRVLLTKDLELYKRANARGVQATFVEGKSEADRLAELAKRYGLILEIDMEKSNCPKCNTKLEAASKEQLETKLQENTFRHYDSFWKCPRCGQIYWQGAHWKQISNTMNEAQAKLEKLKEEDSSSS